ncbi:MAG TPA: hypothetical protein VLI69_01230 [Gammaproteobacteria bacterium]|nr:hypothetical protein [Gammaproteobacteria bacterium]
MFNKRAKHKPITLNFCEAICLAAAVFVICYILRHDDVFPVSINSAWYWFTHWTKYHVLAVALLPVYVAFMVFGTASIGIYLGSTIQRWINQIFS